MSWTNQTKSSTSFSNASKHTAGASWNLKGYMLKEDTFYLLKEDGGKIVLNWGTAKNTGSWNNLTKH